MKSLYLGKVSGTISEGQFVELNQSFQEEKGRLEHHLKALAAERSNHEAQEQKSDWIERAQALLKLETIPRELAVLLIERIEIGERNRDTGQQELKIRWNF